MLILTRRIGTTIHILNSRLVLKLVSYDDKSISLAVFEDQVSKGIREIRLGESIYFPRYGVEVLFIGLSKHYEDPRLGFNAKPEIDILRGELVSTSKISSLYSDSKLVS